MRARRRPGLKQRLLPGGRAGAGNLHSRSEALINPKRWRRHLNYNPTIHIDARGLMPIAS